MENAKHTPGEWKLATAKIGKQIKYQVVADEELVATVGQTSSFETMIANGALLAAAPDLVEALQFLVEAAETEPGMAIYKAHIAKARAVLAKAGL